VSRILFAWELGGGLGHLGPFRPIAERLAARGHEITIAASDVERAHSVFASQPVKIVQAPICTKTYKGIADPPLNYAEILMRYGYLDAPLLAGLVSGWRGLLDLTRADVLVADHAPTALLATRGRGTPRLAFGSPFCVPPPVSPTPAMRSWIEVPRERLENSDASVLEVINGALPSGAPRLAALHEIFEGAETLMIGIPEIDHYWPRNPADYLGLYSGVVGTGKPDWPEGDGPRIFVYLHADYRHIDAALTALAASPARVVIYLLGGTPALREKYSRPRLAFSATPVDLTAAVADSDLCVSQGNFSTVMSTLRGGKPMVLLPTQLEQYLLAARLVKLGLAELVHPESGSLDIAGTLARALANPSLARAARDFALRHREPAVDTIAERTAGRIEALARGRPE
jgi:UDP:flavonoid glycosyltransferase YjiC (YdhE family)